MKNKLFLLLLLALTAGGAFQTSVFSQTNCAGEKVLTEKRCAGDEISEQEKELYRIVNEYRAQNNLPPVPLSESLSLVANRHLLDLTQNLKSLTHSWSNCPYEFNNEKSWNCVFESPKRLNSGYNGRGYENLYRSKTGSAGAVLALEAWKKSDLHNSLLLNLNTFKNTKFDAFGVAINGQYVALWFGSTPIAADGLKKSASESSIGLNFDKMVSGLSKIIPIENSAAFIGGKWAGTSIDKSVMLRLIGSKENLAEASVSIKPEKDSQLNQKQKDIFSLFLQNAAEEWSGRENWLAASLVKIQQNPKMPQTVTLGGKVFVLNVDTQNNMTLTVKPYKKTGAILL